MIFSAPSGSGKTTIVRHLLEHTDLPLAFSISATTRKPRPNEKHGRDYYFLSGDDFKQKVLRGEFLEWEEVYAGVKYGTLRSEVERIWQQGQAVIFDMDVVGGLNLKGLYGEQALAIFVMPPSLAVLEERLRGRKTESEDKLRQRLAKARKELGRADRFDQIILNEYLLEAQEKAHQIAQEFLTT